MKTDANIDIDVSICANSRTLKRSLNHAHVRATAHMQKLAYILARTSIRTRISLAHKQIYTKTHVHDLA